MKNVKLLVLGGIFAGFSIIFQTIPVFFSEIFVILTVFSALPIYIMCRIKPSAGIYTFFSAFILIFIISPHEGIFFFFTNGIIGLSLGLCKSYYYNKKLLPVILSSFVLSTSLTILSKALGVNVFGTDYPFMNIMQFIIFSIFSIVYCAVYNKFAGMVYSRIIVPVRKLHR